MNFLSIVEICTFGISCSTPTGLTGVSACVFGSRNVIELTTSNTAKKSERQPDDKKKDPDGGI